MVLEGIFDENVIINKPLRMLFLGIILSGAAILTSHLIFPSAASVLAIAFITIGAVPIIHEAYLREENGPGEGTTFLERHFYLIKMYAFFFIGLILSYAFWYTVIPTDVTSICVGKTCLFDFPSKMEIFAEQEKTLSGISALKAQITGQAIGSTKLCTSNLLCVFNLIFQNNMKVLILAIITSFIYGAGALFLITWNASVIGILIGKSFLELDFLRFFGLLPHGIPELLGYFVAAMAGGIASAALTRKHHLLERFDIIMKDVFLLLLLSIFSLFVGAIIEAFLITKDEMFGLIISVIYIMIILTLAIGGKKYYYK